MEVASVLKWALLVLLVALSVVASIYLYRRRETPGRGRLLLAVLRGSTFAVLLLLLFDPMLPTAARPSSSGTVLILDASLSMDLPSASGRTRWADALDRARRTSGATTILLSGSTPRRIPRDSLGAVKPMFGESRLLPALQAASESGARKAIVITDGAIEDAQEVQRWLPRLGLDVEVQNVAAPLAGDRALLEVSAPQWAEAGKPFDVRVGVTSTGEGGAPIPISVRGDGTELGTTTLPAPQPGRLSTGTITVTPAATAGGRFLRLDVAMGGQDPVPANDSRSIYVMIGAKPTGIALVSFEPTWEPRFLHPVLEQAVGLPIRSFYRTTPSQFITGGVGTEMGKRVGDEEVATAVREADLVVLHGVGNAIPDWAKEALRTRPRVLVLPREGGADLPGLALPPATPGEWFVSLDIPPSPVAGLVAGLPLQNLTPLPSLHLPRELPTGAWAPLQATRGRRGAAAPIAVAYTEGGRRRVVATAQGYWRWSFRGLEQRTVYARFWGAMAGWLVQEQAQIAGGAVRPAQRVVQQGARPAWLAPGMAADSIRLNVFRDTQVVAQTAIPVQPGDTAFSAILPPGNYRYEARAYAGGAEVGTGSGPLTVETFSAELVRPSRPITDISGQGGLGIGSNRGGGQRPLRTMIWPYLAIVLLLASEWVLRRRWGLR